MPNDLPEKATAELTEREQEILRLLATGTSNKDIAQKLFISSNTVKVHLRNIFAKIGTASRTEAAMYAIRMGLVSSPAPGGAGPSGTPSVDQNGSGLSSIQPEVVPTPQSSRLRFWRISGAVIFILLLAVIGIVFLIVRQQASLAATGTPPAVTPESRWHNLAALPGARTNMAVSGFENQVYAIGGQTSEGVTGITEQYDPGTNTWKVLSPKPVPVADVKAAVIGGKIYIPGGRTASGAVTNVLEIYDPRQNSWERGTDLPKAISAYAMVAFEGQLYLYGGWDGKNYLNSVYVYRPDTRSWSEGKPIPTARSFPGAVVVGGKVYVVGGENQKGKLSVNETSDLSTDGSFATEWQTSAPLPVPASGPELINVVDLVYAVVSDEKVNGIYIFHDGKNASSSSWEFLPMSDKFGPGFSAVLLGTKLYLMGTSLTNKLQPLNVSYDAIYTIVFPITK